MISAISADQKTITLTQQLQYRHLGASYQAGSLHYEIRAEVGLLSRNIKITGTIVHTCSRSNSTAVIRLNPLTPYF